MRVVLLLCLFIPSTALAQDYAGQWLFYDLKLNEKFVFLINKPMRGYPIVSFEGAVGGRYFDGNDEKYQKYKAVIRGQSFNLISELGDRTIMSGSFNPAFTELSGQFIGGDRFVAKKHIPVGYGDNFGPPVYQVVYNGGEVGAEGLERCEKIRDLYENPKIKYSVDLSCENTSGLGGTRSQKQASSGWNMSYRGRTANWLVKPNTFLDFKACKTAMQKVRDEHKCWE